MPKFVVIDIETDSLDWKTGTIHGIGYTQDEDEATYTQHTDRPCSGNALIHALLADPTIPKIGHNTSFDLRFLLNNNYKIAGPIWNTMVMAQLVDENSSVGLKSLVERMLGPEHLSSKGDLDRAIAKEGCRDLAAFISKSIQINCYGDLIGSYCKEDVNNTYKLFLVLWERLQQIDQSWKEHRGALKGPVDYLLEEAQPVEEVLLAMETRGIRLDLPAVERSRHQLEQQLVQTTGDLANLCGNEVKAIEETLYVRELAKRKSEKGKANVERSSDRYKTRFNWASATHVGTLIYEHYGLDLGNVPRTKGGSYSTNDNDLASLRASLDSEDSLAIVLDAFSELRRLEKLRNTYVAADSSLLEGVHNGRVFSLYLQAGSSKDGGKGGTATGRLSSQSPNMQNLPRSGGVKRFFVPDTRSDVFLYFDYSQVELRIAAHVSQDPELLEAYNAGLDLHKMTASSMFGCSVEAVTKEQRQAAKTVNFAMIYDASAFRLHGELGPLGYSLEDCQVFRKAFFAKFSGYHNYLKEQLKLLEEWQALISETGRVRRLPDIVYGQFLNWRRRSLEPMPTELREKLKNYPAERLTESEAFERARKKYKHAQKQGYNFPIQSLGASITKRGLIQLHKMGFDLVSSVHDSIIVQVKQEDAVAKFKIVKQVLEGTYKLTVPLVVDGKVLNSLDETDTVTSLILAKSA